MAVRGFISCYFILFFSLVSSFSSGGVSACWFRHVQGMLRLSSDSPSPWEQLIYKVHRGGGMVEGEG